MGSKQTSNSTNGSVARNPAWGTPESVKEALSKTRGKVIPAAKLLGVSRASLRHRIAELKGAESNGSGHIEVAGSTFRSPLFDLSVLSPDKWEEKRPCWYCGILFAPLRKNNWDQHFCNEEHRVTFNKWGYLPYEKMMLAIKAEIRREVAALVIESFVDRGVSKIRPDVMRVIKNNEIEMREYIRKTVASMISNPEKVRKTLEAAESGEEIPE